ncbi:hypothetical protein R3P38DRAFT_2793890 [Favolaschia claudopus]|uniref:Uncharacterized protein n=1 Tax=Favolaschia claudopus TaxID=2862362 RepID=A0AAW0AAV8_9AGAR
MSSSRPQESLSASHFKKKKSKPSPVSVPLQAGVPAATTVTNKAASLQHSYSPDARTDSLPLRSNPSSRTPELEPQSDSLPRNFPIFIPHRWNVNPLAPFRDVVPIDGSKLEWLRPPSCTRNLLKSKKQKFILTDHLGLLVWMETSKKVRSTFQTYDRDLSRILCFNGASSDIFAGVVEAETYGMPVPGFPFMSIQKNMVKPQTSSSWMYLKEESDPDPQQPLAVPSAETLGRSPRNPFQRLHDGSDGDEDLYLRNPSQHELPTNVLAAFGKLDPSSLKEIRDKLRTVAYADVGRSICPLAMVGDAQSLWLMYDTTMDCLYALGLLDRYVKGLEFVRFETHANFAERFNAGQQRWKRTNLDWSPHNTPVLPPVEEVLHSRAPYNVSGKDMPISSQLGSADSEERCGGHDSEPVAEGSLLQNLPFTTVPLSRVSTPAPEAHESITTDGIPEDQSQGHNESGPIPVAPPLEHSISTVVRAPQISTLSPVVHEAIPTEEAPESPLSSVSSALSDVESDSKHEDTHELLCTNGEAWDAVYHADFQFGKEKNVRFAVKQILREKQTGTCSIHGRYGFLNTEGYIEEYAPCPENMAMDSFREEFLEHTGFSWEEKEPGLRGSGNIRRPSGKYYWVGHSNDSGVAVHPVSVDQGNRLA